MQQRSIIFAALVASSVVGGLWAFPSFWYTKAPSGKFTWLAEHTNISGWTFSETPVAKSQEAVLDADWTVCGEFSNAEKSVQVFSDKRFSDSSDEIGLFVHTPDRCWTESGWKLRTASPDTVELNLHGASIVMERRIFMWRGGEDVLVYFGGLSSGRPLPFRLDHNLTIGQKQQLDSTSGSLGAKSRALDTTFWTRIWNAFEARQQFSGPKHFIRASTRIEGNLIAADERLKAVLNEWLRPGDLSLEFTSFTRKQDLAKTPDTPR